jgi:hypothetical protein
MSKPKRHHFVPRAYIQRFSHEGRILVRWRGRPGLIEVGAQNIAVVASHERCKGLRTQALM